MPDLDIQPIQANTTPPPTGGLDIQPLDIQPVAVPQAEPDPGLLSRGWHMLADPITDAPTRFAKSVSDYITMPSNEDDTYLAGLKARTKGFIGGATEGLGQIATSMTSPLNLATTLATGGESAALKAGLPTIGRTLGLMGKGAGALTALHGGQQIIDPNTSWGEKAMGAAEMAGGGAAMFHVPTVEKSFPGENAAKTSAAADAAEAAGQATKDATGQPKAGTVASAPDDGAIYDKFKTYREVPVGTKYTISPENMNRTKMKDAIKLGFEYQGLDDNGRIIIKKTKPSPLPQQMEDPELEKNALLDAANIPRTVMASMDMSAPLRQGIGLIHKPAFWKALPDMVKAWGSEEAFDQIQKSIRDDPSGLFKKSYNARGEIQPSFAEKAGLSLTDINGKLSNREESIMSQMAEAIPGVRASNRAYTAFLNKLRADTFKQMVTDFGAYTGMEGKNQPGVAKAIAEFVNTASGRGSLGPAENAAGVLSSVLFSPRLIASRLQMMAKGSTAAFSPEVYMLSSPSVRREYLKSLAAIAGTAGTFATLGKLAGAEIESDPASSDFGKVKFGNTRIDPYAGFQQPIVLMQRLMPHIDLSSMGLGEIGGQMKSTTTGHEYSLLDPSFGRSTQADVLGRFIRSKTNPIINFGWGLLAGEKELSGKPMNFTAINPVGPQGENLFDNSIAQRFLPMLSQDIYDLVQDETTPVQAKALAAFMASVGMGSQTYGN